MSFPIKHGLFKYSIEDHYAILGLPVNADSQVIRQRYLKIAYRLHPDTCKEKTEQGKKLANKLLSKLVNPAYEVLSKEQSRSEYRIVLGQTGRTLALESDKITVNSQSAKKLCEATRNIDLVYLKLINPLATEQYQQLKEVFGKIAQLSELNLVYLVMQSKKVSVVQTPSGVNSAPDTAKITSQSQKLEKKPEPEKKSFVSPIDSSIRRAQEYLERKNTSQAIVELREALKTDPNNCLCHGLLGLAYLQENQLTMAKIHINKAWTGDRYNPIVIQAKQALNKQLNDDKKSSDQSSDSGFFNWFKKNK